MVSDEGDELIGSAPPWVGRLLEAEKAGLLKHGFRDKHPYAHEARLLFFSVLDEEWPDLKRELFLRCWPLFQSACAPFNEPRNDCTAWSLPVADRGEKFLVPLFLLNLRSLEISRESESLRLEFIAWSQAGRGIRDQWFLESAFYTLRTVSPTSRSGSYDGSNDGWRYPFERTFPHRWPIPPPKVNVTASAKELKQAGRLYEKQRALRFEVPSTMNSDHARWTIARLSDAQRTWPMMVDRFAPLGRYEDGVSEAKRRVRHFASWIDLTIGSA